MILLIKIELPNSWKDRDTQFLLKDVENLVLAPLNVGAKIILSAQDRPTKLGKRVKI